MGARAALCRRVPGAACPGSPASPPPSRSPLSAGRRGGTRRGGASRDVTPRGGLSGRCRGAIGRRAAGRGRGGRRGRPPVGRRPGGGAGRREAPASTHFPSLPFTSRRRPAPRLPSALAPGPVRSLRDRPVRRPRPAMASAAPPGQGGSAPPLAVQRGIVKMVRALPQTPPVPGIPPLPSRLTGTPTPHAAPYGARDPPLPLAVSLPGASRSICPRAPASPTPSGAPGPLPRTARPTLRTGPGFPPHLRCSVPGACSAAATARPSPAAARGPLAAYI